MIPPIQKSIPYNGMRWDWQIGRVTPMQRTGARAVDIYDIDGFLTTRAEVRQIHDRWQARTLAHPKAVCYLDLAWEDYRPDASPGGYFPAATLGKVYFGYPQERWVDFRQLDQLKPMLDERISRCARKGFDAVELDDIDSFDPPSTTGFHLTVGDAQNFLAWALNEVHRHGMTVLWKNAPGLAWWGCATPTGRSSRSATSTTRASRLRRSAPARMASRAPRSAGRPRAAGTCSPRTAPRASPPASGWARPSTTPTASSATPGSAAADRTGSRGTASSSTRRVTGSPRSSST